MFDPTTMTHTLLAQVARHYHHLGYLLYGVAPDQPTDPSALAGPLQQDMLLLTRVANGELDRSTVSDEQIAAILEALHRVVDVLTVPAGGAPLTTVSSTFWAQPGIGQVLTHVHAWLRQDDLIGYSAAARLLFPHLAEENIQAARMRIKRLVERGTVLSYLDPTEPNPTHQVRVSRQAIEALAFAWHQRADSAPRQEHAAAAATAEPPPGSGRQQ